MERSGTTASIKTNANPYSGWFKPLELQAEARRLSALPPASETINRWRRHRIWQIQLRLKEIYKGSNGNVKS